MISILQKSYLTTNDCKICTHRITKSIDCPISEFIRYNYCLNPVGKKPIEFYFNMCLYSVNGDWNREFQAT